MPNQTWRDYISNSSLSGGISTVLSAAQQVAFVNQTAKDYVNSTEKEVIEDIKKLGNATFNINALSTIEGLPYQFLPNVDRRIEYKDNNKNIQLSSVGRKYNEKILDRMPLLFLMPCIPKFRSNNTNYEALSGTLSKMAGVTNEMLTSFFNNGDDSVSTGRYFETQFSFYGYYQHLQTMLTVLATYLGIINEKVYFNGDLVPIGDIKWGDLIKDSESFSMYFTGKESVAFYVDGFDSVSESFDNDTTKPSIASDFDNVSDEAREVRFLFGKNQAFAADALGIKNFISRFTNNINGNLFSADENGNTGFNLSGINIEGLASEIIKYSGSEIYNDLLSHSSHTLYQGGRILFPEIWADSQYNKSYNLNIKLRSPDHDKVSIFMNILVPYCKLLALTLPHATSDVLGESTGEEVSLDPNTYFSPYLVKAYSKGTINIDMGIIDSLSVTKGATCQWTVDGLPTQIDIDISIKDLYHSLAMSGWNGTESSGPLSAALSYIGPTWQVVSNSAYMDFLANMAGLNVKDTHRRKVGLFLDLAKAKFKYTGANLRAFANNYVANKIRDFYDNF